ncbi:hypothetical protein BMS3Bbin10_02054 [bacterium BMS3Bbin10]|nr:hypothetical protein BMS3Bbin10_02054 [bacterium BMS3Bbin10]HDL16309.1 hypothetical protein [Hyphomicrobiales bacterium]
MRQRSPQFLLSAALALTLAAPAGAQSVKGLNAPGAGAPSLPSSEAPSQFLIEPEAEIKGDRIKQQTYRSQAVGQNRNWDLDIGRFQAPINEDPNQLADDLTNSDFSGMRLRLPFRGRTGN